MATSDHEVLELEDEVADKSFSGFSSVDSENDVPVRKSRGRPRVKSAVVKPKKVTVKRTKAKSQRKQSESEEAPFDVSKLSGSDIAKLREALGISGQAEAEENDSFMPFEPIENLPNMRIEIDSCDVSDNENRNVYPNSIGADMSHALFDVDTVSQPEECLWSMPSVKMPKKGEAIGQSLADMINTACSSLCDIENTTAKHKVPRNCERACAPTVNGEVWKVMDRRAQTLDRGLADIQNMVAAGMTPIIKLAEVMKKDLAKNAEAQGLISDALVTLGQVQYSMSVKRRYFIRPSLKRKYQSICNMSQPITSQLFGDDVAKDIKSCDNTNFLGHEQRFVSRRGGRNFQRPYRGASRGYYGARFQPYQSQGPTRGHERVPVRNALAGYRIPRRSAPAATAPNPN